MTLKTGANSALHHRNKLHLKICSNTKQFFQIVIMFHNITVFLIRFNSAEWFVFGAGDRGVASEQAKVSRAWRFHSERRPVLLQERHREHCGRRCHAEVHLRGAGVLEPPHPNQLQLPVHLSQAHCTVGSWRGREILHTASSTVEYYFIL